MYVIENRARRNASPLLFWEVTPLQPEDETGRPVTLGKLPDEFGYERRVIGRAQSVDSLVGLLSNQDVGRVEPRVAERAWRAAENYGPAEIRRIEPSYSAMPIASDRRGYDAHSSRFAARTFRTAGPGVAATADNTGLMLAVLFIVAAAVVILWMALI